MRAPKLKSTALLTWLFIALVVSPVNQTISSRVDAAEPDAVQLLPETTVAYLELRDPTAMLASMLDHPLAGRIQELDVYRTATTSQAYRNFLTGRFMLQLKMKVIPMRIRRTLHFGFMRTS